MFAQATFDGDYGFQREAYIRSDDSWLKYDVVDLENEFPEAMYHILNKGLSPWHSDIEINGCIGADGYFRWWDNDDFSGRRFENCVLAAEGLEHPNIGHLQIQLKIGKPYIETDWEKDIPHGYVCIAHNDINLRDQLVNLIFDLEIIDHYQLSIFYESDKVSSLIMREYSGTVGSYRKLIKGNEF